MTDERRAPLDPVDAALVGVVLLEFLLWTHYPRPSPSQVLNTLIGPAPSEVVRGISRYALLLRGAANVAALCLAASVLAPSRWSRLLRYPALSALAVTLVIIPVAGEVALRHAEEARLDRGEIATLQAHDGMIQAEVAADLLRAGNNPYTADYTPTLMGRSGYGPGFFTALGYRRNPALAHLPYPPAFVSLVAATRVAFGRYDLRWLTLAFALALAATCAYGRSPGRRALTATAVLLSPLTDLPLISGLNDPVHLLPVALGAIALRRGNLRAAAFAWGCAAALKQLDAVLLPALLALAWSRSDRRERARLVALALGPAVLTLLPFALWNFRALFEDLVLFHAGRGPEPYPIHPRSSSAGVLSLGLDLVRRPSEPDPLGPLWLLIALGCHAAVIRRALRDPDPRLLLRGIAFAAFATFAASRSFALNYAALPAVLHYFGALSREASTDNGDDLNDQR